MIGAKYKNKEKRSKTDEIRHKSIKTYGSDLINFLLKKNEKINTFKKYKI